MMVRLTISMHFQQFEGLKFQFFPGENPCRASKPSRLSLNGIVPSFLDFSQDIHFPILEISFHKPMSRETAIFLLNHAQLSCLS